jgi:hypothetical protein
MQELGKCLRNETSEYKIKRLLNVYYGRKNRNKTKLLYNLKEQKLNMLIKKRQSLQKIYKINKNIISKLVKLLA